MSFRYHVVTLVAVFLALAAGVALGGGPLSELGRSEPTDSTADPAALLAARRQADFAGSALEGAAPRLYADELAGHPVAVLAMPGVADSTRAAVQDQVLAAGGSVAGSYTVEPALVAAGEKSLVDTLGSQLMTQIDNAGVDPQVPTYERMGQLLGLAIASTRPQGAADSEDADSVRQSLAGAGLLTAEEDLERRAAYVVVLLGADTAAEEDPIYTGLLAGLSEQAVGVVVAADAEDGATGRLSRLREDPVADAIATVDGVEDPAGQVTTVLVLGEWPATRARAYGASGADGAVGLR